MTTTTTEQHPDDVDEPGPYWRSARTAAAAAVLACAAAGIAWAFTGGGDTSTTPASTPYDSACGLTGGDTAEPTRGPDVQWQTLEGNWLPVSTAHGPGRRSLAGPWSCYSHTPTGAALAAWGIPAGRTAVNFATAVRQQTLPGPGQAALLKRGPSTVAANELPVPVGFRMNAYDAEVATVTLYVQQRGKNLRCATSVQWIGGERGDWVQRLTADGSVWSGCQLLPDDLAGEDFLRWGPNS